MIDLSELKEIKENTAKYLHRIMVEIEPCIVIELCERVIAAEAKLAEIEKQEPVFYYRPRMDDGYEGPIHAKSIEKVRIDSGVWKPLYASPVQQSPAVAVPDAIEHAYMAGQCDAGIDPSYSSAKAYAEKMLSTTTPAADYKAQRDELLLAAKLAFDEWMNTKKDKQVHPKCMYDLGRAIAKASASNAEGGE